jgi:hypothetical protein
MTEVKVQALVDCGLLRPKAVVELKAPAGEASSTKDDKEHVVFTSFFERGFNILACDFFRGLLFYYKMEMVHLIPNSITKVSSFIYFYQAYLGIPPHFLLWRHLFNIKSINNRLGVVGSIMFCLRPGLKEELIDMYLPDNTVGWRSEWFDITDQQLVLLKRIRHKLEKIPKWDLQLTSRELDDIKELLPLVHNLEKKGLTWGSMARSFYHRLIQPIKDRVHPAYEHWGQSDPTREVNRKVSQKEMVARVSQIYTGGARGKKCSNAHSLTRPADPVSPKTSRSFCLV